METKTFYAVEYKSGNDGQTFDIFENIENAKSFAKNIHTFGSEYKPLYLFKAKFNSENIYKEDDGTWNYEDFSNTLISESSIILEKYS